MKRRKDAIDGNFSDDSLWFVLSTVVYLKGTRDWDTLEEMVPYENVPGSKEALYSRLKRSLACTEDDLAHGLLLIRRLERLPHPQRILGVCPVVPRRDEVGRGKPGAGRHRLKTLKAYARGCAWG